MAVVNGNMADWTLLHIDIMSYIFKKIPEERATGRLVCKSWCDSITEEATHTCTSLNLFGKTVSLLSVYDLFPKLKVLKVELPFNVDPDALFLWTTLEHLIVVTRWRSIFGHDYKPSRLDIRVGEDPSLIQVYYCNNSPISTCDNILPLSDLDWEEQKAIMDEREFIWDNVRDTVNHVQSEDWGELYIDESELDDRYDETALLVQHHECGWFCLGGLEFALKGVGNRSPAPIVHQAFGVDHKPADWDLEVELMHGIYGSTIRERLPFFTDCQIVAVCQIDPREDEGDDYKKVKAVWRNLHRSVLAPDTILLVARLPWKSASRQGRHVVYLDYPWVSTTLPPLLPEHGGYHNLMSKIARSNARLARRGRVNAAAMFVERGG